MSRMIEHPFLRESLLAERLGSKIRCNVCERRCVLVCGGIGWCRTRINSDGTLLTLIYGSVSAIEANPIEKKPFYHFQPGTVALTVSSWSCNFGCPWCENWRFSKAPPPFHGTCMSPEDFVSAVQRTGSRGISVSGNEPTLSLEWSLDVFRLARQLGYYRTYVTNGYMTPEALDLLSEAGLDAMNVDVKADASGVRKYCRSVDMEKVWNVCRISRSRGVHLEITTLVVPGVNDIDAVLSGIAERIVADLGRDVPWHVAGYSPAYRFTTLPVPVRTLDRACELGSKAGLKCVYSHNAAGHVRQHTFCPDCGFALIVRSGFSVLSNTLRGGSCSVCGASIPGVWGDLNAWK